MTTAHGLLESGTGSIAWRLDGPSGAPVLVLANSLGTDLRIWEPQVAAFSRQFRVLRYDQRGHGRSGPVRGPCTIDDLGGDLLVLLDELAVGRASLCGLSLGGMVAMWLAARAPARVERLVLCCTAPFLPPPSSWTARAAAVRRGGVGQLVPTLLERWFPDGFADSAPDVVVGVAAMVEACDPESYAACCEAIAAMDLRGDLCSIAAPTLVLAGAQDPVTTPAMALELAGSIAGASLHVLAGAAHLANLARPSQFADAVLGHLVGPAFERGSAVRREVLGEAHVAAAAAQAGPLGAPFLDLATRYAWGEVWSRPGLDRRTRSAITLAVLTALGRSEELSFHTPAALRNGLSTDELAEIFLHTALYAGLPAVNSAIPVAERALGALEGPGEDGEASR